MSAFMSLILCVEITLVMLSLLFQGKPSYINDEINLDWAPTVNLGHNKISMSALERSVKRSERRHARAAKRWTIADSACDGDVETNRQ